MTARQLAAAVALLTAFAISAKAETYPSRPVTIVTPFAAGSVTDAAARLIAQSLQETLGQPFIVENRAGAGGLLAASAVARAKNDGYTLLLTTNSTHSAANGLFKSVPYDPIKDFTPIARIGSFPSFVAVNPSQPINSMQELVAYAKANPGKLSYGVGNSTGQITGETIKKRTGIDIVRVNYRSNPAALTDLIAGHIQVMIPDFNTGLAQVSAKAIRPLAVLTKDRNPALPDVPTLSETVMPGFDILAWAGMFGPANMPPEATKALADSIEKALKQKEIRDRFASAGTDIYWSGPKDFDAFVKSELVKWTAAIKEAGIEPE
ncbi:tripartite tricarboxylate transporter substrate binding protein [Leptospira sp. severe_002]|uniref:Bug family tripartite tricarboxylate transporter substrate binding protein n=1 Tax=Leptospira sp. severe_002 TaxID=2838237 RepID=UPI001E4E7A0C|nr:tripartite tricarboxylate transporter substrate binding protein [Leptospira sp. severe_002]